MCLVAAGCGSPPPDPGATVPAGTERITGSERLGWSQEAGSVEELATFHYLIYVEDAANEAQGVTCTTDAGPAGFSCTAGLPSMTAGQHVLMLSTYIEVGGTRLESPRSTPINVLLVIQTSTASADVGAAGAHRAATITTLDGVQLRSEVVVEGLDDPTDLAFGPDGGIFIAERAGRVRVVRGGRLVARPALALPDVSTSGRQGLLALAVDPDYALNRFVYLVYATTSGFQLARVRAVGDSLGDRAVLMDAIPASPRPSAALRFGPDARLYLGLDDAGDPRRPGDLGSFNGKLLRLNSDATTPRDQPRASPVYLGGLSAPRAVDWSANGATMWVLDVGGGSGGVLQAAQAAASGAIVSRYNLPAGTGASALAVYRGDLIRAFRGNVLVAADQDRSLLRLAIADEDPTRVVSTERLLGGSLDGVRALGVGPDGAIYFCTARALVKLSPPPTAGLQ